MRIFFVLISCITFALATHAQQKRNLNDSRGFSSDLGATEYNFDVGTAVGTSFNDSYYFTNYFSPSAKINLTEKFSAVAGIGVRYSQYNNILTMNNEYDLQKTDAQITSIFGYASGIYKLNSKVNLNATVLFEDNMITTPEAPMALQKQYKDVSLGLNYNVTKHISINAQMHITDKPFNTYNQGTTSFGLGSPIGYSPLF